MYDIEHEFEEVGLCVGKDKNGNRQIIALVTGMATINVKGVGRWHFESIELTSPIADAETVIDIRTQLWDYLVDSISHDCGEAIWHKTVDVCQPNPDRKHDEAAQ